MEKAVTGSRLRAVVLGVALGVVSGVAQANPKGATVVNGQVRFGGAAGVLNITNSPGAIINWQSFSIRQGEITRFLQQNANSAVLNRVIGQDPSAILGTLLSNGRVFVVNPNGIIFGRNAVVNTQGLIASTLNIRNADFLAGKYEFAAAAGAGAIRNQGFIRSGPGGEVVLIAPSIENSGIIQADDGELVLAAGRKVTLTSLDAAGVSFDVQAPEDSVLNLGQLIARRGSIGAFGGTLRNTGRIEAGGVGRDAAGNIVLMAKSELVLEPGSVVDASGTDGGTVHIESGNGSVTVDGVVDARGTRGRGGKVDITGADVVLEAAVDASGERGGGSVRVGGGYRGEGELRTAARTEMTEQASIDVSARGKGDGGLAVVWADGTAEVRGSGNIAARGGARGGDGGTVETSGKQLLFIGGAPDASAAAGDGGLWLLDPLDVEIISGGDFTGPFTPPPVAGESSIDADTLVQALQMGTDVTITTTGPGTGGTITVASGLDAIDMSAVSPSQQAILDLVADKDVIVAATSGGIRAFNGDLSLRMNAAADIDIRADVTHSGAGDLQLNAPGGFIYVRNGATVSVDDADASSQGIMNVGFQDAGPLPGQGTLDINNGGSWAHNGSMSAGVGAGGSGNINVSSGATLSVTQSSTGLRPGIQLGADAGAVGRMTVDGVGTLVEISETAAPFLGGPFMQVGVNGSGFMTVSDSAQVVMRGPEAGIDVGQGSGSIGELTVENRGELKINAVDALNPLANEQESYFNVARDAGSQGVVLIKDLDTLVTIEGTNAADGSGVVVNVGRGGDGTLSLSDRAVMQISAPDAAPFPGMNIGGSSASAGTGSVTVDDAQLQLTGNTPFLAVGRNGTGGLDIRNDGRVSDPTFVTVGRDALSTGTISMSNGAFLSLLDTASAQAAALDPFVVEGDGAALIVGRAGSGQLDMQDSSQVTIDGTPILGGPTLGPDQGAGLFVGRRTGGDGRVSIADSELKVTRSPTPQMVVGDGGTALVELLGGASVLLDGPATLATVGAQGGSDRVLSFLDGGQLDADDVINGGTVQGTGLITGNLLAAPGLPNTVSPGASAGTLRVDGDFTANAQTILAIELGGTDDQIPEYDILDVGGVATLAGQIEVSLIDDFTPGYAPLVGDLFTIVRAGSTVQDQGVQLVLVPPAVGLIPLFSTADLTLEAVLASPTGLWTGNGDGTTWGDPFNWEGDLLPGSADEVRFPELAGQTVIDFDVPDTFILSLSMVGDDILAVNGGLLNISDTAVADTVVVNGGSLVASLDVSRLQLNGGTLEQGPVPIVAGEFEWNGGDVQGETGILTDVFKLDTPGARSLDGAITVSGSGVWGSGLGRVTVNGAGVNRPAITAAGTAAVDIVGNLTLAGLDLTNNGLLDKTGGGGVSNFSALINAGTLKLGAGTTNADSFLQDAPGAVLSLEGGDIASASLLEVQDGIVQGSGSIDADLSMSGPSVLSPGLSIGDLSISGELRLAASARVVIEVDGQQPGAFDTVTAGTVDLTGGPILDVAGTFVPTGADTVTPILCTAGPGCLTGTFGDVNLVSGTIPSVAEIYQPDSVDLLLSAAEANLWLGGEDLLWTTPGNWSQGAVPDADSEVQIGTALGPITINGLGLEVDSLTTSTELILAGGDFSVFNDSFIGADFRLVAGILDGPGDITVGGDLILQSTILRGSGQLEVAAGGALRQSGITTVDGRSLINRSSGTSSRLTGRIEFLNAGQLINSGNLQLDSATLGQGAGAAGRLGNNGNLGMTDSTVNVAINNVGTVNLGGDFELLAAQLSNLSGGVLNLQGDTRVFGSGSITNQGALFKLGGGTASVAVPVTTSTGVNVTTGTLTFSRDSFLGGNLNTGPDGVLAITGGSHQLADGTAFGGAGTVRLNGTRLLVNGSLSNAADLRIGDSIIDAQGSLDNTGSVRLGDGVALNMSSFSNRAGAELRKVAGSGESILGMPLNSVGDVAVERGTLRLAAFNQGGGTTTVEGGATLAVDDALVLQGGTLGGNGRIDGNVFNGGGVLSAGSSPGILSIDGNYVQGSDGELRVELSGLAPGQYDVLVVSGTASLDGTLKVRFDLPSFPGATGDLFRILFASELELLGGPLGFSSLDVQDGYQFDPNQAVLSDGFQLVVTDTPLDGLMAPPSSTLLDEALSQALGEEVINQVLATADADGVDEQEALLSQVSEGGEDEDELVVGICQ